ncbi:unnamed protein product [Amoebophrya sp. A120]|nr:unnamed protein product [Amoebophrya sp. A120]|eukprot:GSA120T00007905001.1
MEEGPKGSPASKIASAFVENTTAAAVDETATMQENFLSSCEEAEQSTNKRNAAAVTTTGPFTVTPSTKMNLEQEHQNLVAVNIYTPSGRLFTSWYEKLDKTLSSSKAKSSDLSGMRTKSTLKSGLSGAETTTTSNFFDDTSDCETASTCSSDSTLWKASGVEGKNQRGSTTTSCASLSTTSCSLSSTSGGSDSEVEVVLPEEEEDGSPALRTESSVEVDEEIIEEDNLMSQDVSSSAGAACLLAPAPTGTIEKIKMSRQPDPGTTAQKDNAAETAPTSIKPKNYVNLQKNTVKDLCRHVRNCLYANKTLHLAERKHCLQQAFPETDVIGTENPTEEHRVNSFFYSAVQHDNIQEQEEEDRLAGAPGGEDDDEQVEPPPLRNGQQQRENPLRAEDFSLDLECVCLLKLDNVFLTKAAKCCQLIDESPNDAQGGAGMATKKKKTARRENKKRKFFLKFWLTDCDPFDYLNYEEERRRAEQQTAFFLHGPETAEYGVEQVSSTGPKFLNFAVSLYADKTSSTGRADIESCGGRCTNAETSVRAGSCGTTSTTVAAVTSSTSDEAEEPPSSEQYYTPSTAGPVSDGEDPGFYDEEEEDEWDVIPSNFEHLVWTWYLMCDQTEFELGKEKNRLVFKLLDSFAELEFEKDADFELCAKLLNLGKKLSNSRNVGFAEALRQVEECVWAGRQKQNQQDESNSKNRLASEVFFSSTCQHGRTTTSQKTSGPVPNIAEKLEEIDAEFRENFAMMGSWEKLRLLPWTGFESKTLEELEKMKLVECLEKRDGENHSTIKSECSFHDSEDEFEGSFSEGDFSDEEVCCPEKEKGAEGRSGELQSKVQGGTAGTKQSAKADDGTRKKCYPLELNFSICVPME